MVLCFCFCWWKVFLFLRKTAFFLEHPSDFFKHLGQGFVFYGSFLFTVPTLIWWFRRNNVPVAFGFDYLAIGGALVHGFGKIGCFMAGCCHGIACLPEDGVVLQIPNLPLTPWMYLCIQFNCGMRPVYCSLLPLCCFTAKTRNLMENFFLFMQFFMAL